MLVPPINFSLVVGTLYRSGHPIALNYPFLSTLKLKTIIYLGNRTEEENSEYYEWARSQGINVVAFDVSPVKEPFCTTDKQIVEQCLELVVDAANYPILVHSDKGKHRVGVLIGTIRKILLHWSLTAIYQEYVRFARGKAGIDVVFIEQYEPENLAIDMPRAPEWVRRNNNVN